MKTLGLALVFVIVGFVIVWYAARQLNGDAAYDLCTQRGQSAQLCGYDRCLHQGGSALSCSRFITGQ